MSLRKPIAVITFLSFLLLIGCGKQQPAPVTPQAPQNSSQTPPTTNPPTETAPTTTEISGTALFATNCAGCHGANGAGGSAPALNTDEWKNNSSKVQDITKKGKGSMPAFSDKLNDTQIKAIGDYVASLKK